MTEARDLLVYPHDGKYVVLGGNIRMRAYQKLGWKEVPCCVLLEGMPPEKLRAVVMQDNNPFGDNDWDALANEWDAAELDDWGFDVWQEPKEEAPKAAKAKEEEKKEEEKFDIASLMLADRIYDSDNAYDIPTLRTDRQPNSGLLLPFFGWGTDTRLKKGIQTYHFYVEDYRFTNIWNDPAKPLQGGCSELVEPNLSLFDTTPVAYGLQLIYMKRWIARYWQECGARVYADLNVARKFYEYNKLGIPQGYNAFATRGYADREEYLKLEIEIARQLSGLDKPNMIVYGGGERIREICLQSNVFRTQNESGMKRTPDGYLFMASFEQRTPQGGSYRNVVKGLEHAKKKSSEIAVLYDKHGVHTRSSIEKGISQYEYLNKYRFKEIIVISKDGRIHRHKHNA